MVLASPHTPPPYAPLPQRGPGCSRGCLVGCLIAALLLFLPVVLAGSYGAWFLTQGFRRDPVLKLASELVREDSLAHRVLGDGAVITGVEGNYFSWMPGGARNAYVVTLEGSKGEGHLAVSGHAGFAGPKLDTAILTGPDGRRYDLLNNTALPGAAAPDSSGPDHSI